MIADGVELARLRTGQRAEGVLLATNVALRKFTSGLGVLFVGGLLTSISFPQDKQEV